MLQTLYRFIPSSQRLFQTLNSRSQVWSSHVDGVFCGCFVDEVFLGNCLVSQTYVVFDQHALEKGDSTQGCQLTIVISSSPLLAIEKRKRVGILKQFSQNHRAI